MAVGTCASCAAVGPIEQHHPTGRLDGDYLDRALTVPLCLRCHAAVHATWECLALGPRRVVMNGAVDLVELRLRRQAATLGRLGQVAPWIPVQAAAQVAWADELREVTP